MEEWYLGRLNWALRAGMLYGISVKLGETLLARVGNTEPSQYHGDIGRCRD